MFYCIVIFFICKPLGLLCMKGAKIKIGIIVSKLTFIGQLAFLLFWKV